MEAWTLGSVGRLLLYWPLLCGEVLSSDLLRPTSCMLPSSAGCRVRDWHEHRLQVSGGETSSMASSFSCSILLIYRFSKTYNVYVVFFRSYSGCENRLLLTK
ncbi:hypothetical protein Droror1_Dr00017177 [Drosera rotundifolia]